MESRTCHESRSVEPLPDILSSARLLSALDEAEELAAEELEVPLGPAKKGLFCSSSGSSAGKTGPEPKGI